MSFTPLTPPPGLIGDDTSYASKGAYRDADKVRFREGRGQTIGGWERITRTALTGVCRAVLQWTSIAGALQIAFATNSALQVYRGGGLYDITPAGLAAGQVNGTGGRGRGTGAFGVGTWGQPSTADYFPRTWSLAPYGGDLIASPRNGTIYRWQQDTGTPAAALAGAPAQVTCCLVTNERQVMAFGCTPADGSAFDPLMIRWSDVNGNITTWAPGVGNNAGFTRLVGAGRIVGALMVGDNVLVWTDAALYLGTYTGTPGALWTFEQQGEHGGLIGPNAAAAIGQTAYWISPSRQFWTYSLGGEPSIYPCTIRDDFVANLAPSQQDKITASTVSAFGEVWWFYPDVRDGPNGSGGLENSRAIFVAPAPANLLAPSAPNWSRAQLARTAFCDGDPSLYPIGVDPAGSAYYQEKGASADGGAITYSLETADQALGDEDMQVRGMRPDFADQVGALAVYVITRMFPQGPETVRGPFPCPPGKQKIDLRITARIARVRYVSTASPSGWRVGAPAFDVVPAGRGR